MPTDYTHDIQQLYVAYFGRPAETAGLAQWQGYLQTHTIAEAASAFAGSLEYQTQYPASLTPYARVNAIYHNLFNRAALPLELHDWGQTLIDGTYSIDQIVRIVANGARDTVGGAPDLTTLTEKIAAATTFTNALDTTEKILSYSGGNVADARAFITSVVDHATELAATTPAALAATILAIENAYNIGGQTFILTGGADTIPGLVSILGTTSNVGNDVIRATELTLTSNDILDGGDGTDTLKLHAQTATATYAAFQMKNVETVQVTSDNGFTQTLDMSGSTGVTTFETLNSLSDVIWKYVTKVDGINLNVTNITNNSNVRLFGQATAVSGPTTVNVHLNSNANANVGTIELGWINNFGVTTDKEIETVNVTVAGNNHVVGTLLSDITTLNVYDGDITGHHDLTIITALNKTVRTVDAGTFTGSLDINLTGNTATTGANALHVTTGSGNDVLDLFDDGSPRDVVGGTVTGDATIRTGDGNDTVYLGLGNDTVDLGKGDDSLTIHQHGLTVLDTITGGEGHDTIHFVDADTYVHLTESLKVSEVEVFSFESHGARVEVSQNLINTATGGFTVSTALEDGSNIVDVTNVASIAGFHYEGGAADDVVIATESQINSAGTFAFGAGIADTLRVVNSTHLTTNDLLHVTGLDIIQFVSDGTPGQNFELDLNNTVLLQATQNIGGSVTNGLTIELDPSINPVGTVVTINLTGFTPAQAAAIAFHGIHVINGAALTVNYIYGNVAPTSIYETLPPDANHILNFTGVSGNTTSGFEIQNGLIAGGGDDSINIFNYVLDATAVVQGGGGTDTLHASSGADIHLAALASVENLIFSGDFTATIGQHNAFGTINGTGGADKITVYDNVAGNTAITGNASIETYTFIDGAAGDTHTFTLGSLTQNVIESITGAADTYVLGAGHYTNSFSALDGIDTIQVVNGTDISAVSGLDASARNLNLTGTVTLTANQYNSFASAGGTIVAAGAADGVIVTTSSTALLGNAAVEHYTLNGPGADTIKFNEAADATLTDAVRAHQTVDLAGGGSDILVIGTAAVNNGVDSHITVTNFVAGDTLQLFAGATSASNGIFNNNYTGAAIGLATGSVLEVDAATYQLGTFSNTGAVQGWLAAHGVTHTAATAAPVTVVVYDGAGHAGVYEAVDSTATLGAIFNSIELVGVVNAANNVLTSANFA